MSLLARAYYDRLVHKPRPMLTNTWEPKDPRYGLLPGWVSSLLRRTFAEY
jgi:hypothetical protein